MSVIQAVKPYRISLAFASGLLLAAAFPKINLFWLAWFAPGLTLMLGIGQSGKKVFAIGFAAGLGRYLVSLYWFLLIPIPAYAFAAWFAMSVALSLFVGTWCWLCWRLFPRTGAGWPRLALWPAFCAVAWVAMEMGFAHVPTRFPWNLLGTSQYRLLPLIQIASVTGVYGVSFIVAWMSAALMLALRHYRHVRIAIGIVAGPWLLLGITVLFGLKQVALPTWAPFRLKVALVQPGTAQQQTNRLDRLLELSQAALSNQASLLVWPEAPFAATKAATSETQEIISGLARAHNIWMIFGAENPGRRELPEKGESADRFNSAFLVNPTGDLVTRYYKQHLAPFHLESPRANISMLISSEDLFPQRARESVDKDTDILLNLSNDSCFGETAAQWQHAIGALFRAVENGVPLVRCTHNGLTGWTDPQGRMHDVYFRGSTDIYQPGFKLAEIPLHSQKRWGRTLYNRWGDLFGWSCVAITLCAGLWSFRSFARSRQTATAT